MTLIKSSVKWWQPLTPIILSDPNYSEMTAKLWMAMLTQIAPLADSSQVPFVIMQKLSKAPKAKVQSFLDEKLGGW